MGETCFAKVLKMRRINWTFERKRERKGEKRWWRFFFYATVIFARFIETIFVIQRDSSFGKEKRFSVKLLRFFSREITYINVYKISYLVTSMSRRIYIYIRKSSLFNGDINIYFTLKIDPNLPWNLGEINVSKKKKEEEWGKGKSG